MTATHCPYCAMQCAMTLQRDAGGRVTVDARNGLCQKGWTAAELLDHPERLVLPLIRENGVLQPATWEAALDRIAAELSACSAGMGRPRLGCSAAAG
jgi:assimilatory nitrate reductase catalytic subunit